MQTRAKSACKLGETSCQLTKGCPRSCLNVC